MKLLVVSASLIRWIDCSLDDLVKPFPELVRLFLCVISSSTCTRNSRQLSATGAAAAEQMKIDTLRLSLSGRT